MIRDLSVDFPDFLIAINQLVWGKCPRRVTLENKDDHAPENWKSQ